MAKVLILNQSKSVRKTLHERVSFEGHSVLSVESVEELSKMNRVGSVALIICDNQFDSLPSYVKSIPLIIISSQASVDDAMRAAKCGAHEFLTTPIDMNRLLDAMRSALEENNEESSDGKSNQQQSSRRSQRRAKSSSQHPIHREIIGESGYIQDLLRTIDKVAKSDARVMILGENGTGKEMVADRLHCHSSRAEYPFIEVNCAAIPSELIESELFGHEKGAFTSAVRQRKGKFEQADGGTLFLDEIGDMSLSAQAKVLRALQEHRISRVGSDVDIDVDVRVIAATNKDIRCEIAKGNFREDLYHRLSVIVLRVAPLRERSEDIPLLVDHFLDTICQEYKVERKSICGEALDMLSRMTWSGNIRELRNVVERLVVLCDDEILGEDIHSYVESD